MRSEVRPQLTTTYNAGELHDAHPVRFTNEGLRLDHKPENAIEWYVKIPHHEDYHLWMPAQPNPEQQDWLEALNAGGRHDGRESAIRAGRNGIFTSPQPATQRAVPRCPTKNGHPSVSILGKRRSSRCVTVTTTVADRSRTMGRRREDRSSAPARPTSPPRGDFRHAVARTYRRVLR